jgi:hypothetical protein
MILKKFLILFFTVISLFCSAQTDLVKRENKTISKKDLVKINRITQFFPMLPDSITFMEGTLICQSGGEKYTQEYKSAELDKRSKELLTYSDVNTKIYIDIKYIDLSEGAEITRSATVGIKVLE